MEKINKKDFIKSLWVGNLDLVYPRDNSQESAIVLSNTLKGALAVVQFLNEDNKIIYGVLCDFSKVKNGGYGPITHDNL